jgi:hypothetical protein
MGLRQQDTAKLTSVGQHFWCTPPYIDVFRTCRGSRLCLISLYDKQVVESAILFSNILPYVHAKF